MLDLEGQKSAEERSSVSRKVDMFSRGEDVRAGPILLALSFVKLL